MSVGVGCTLAVVVLLLGLCGCSRETTQVVGSPHVGRAQYGFRLSMIVSRVEDDPVGLVRAKVALQIREATQSVTFDRVYGRIYHVVATSRADGRVVYDSRDEDLTRLNWQREASKNQLGSLLEPDMPLTMDRRWVPRIGVDYGIQLPAGGEFDIRAETYEPRIVTPSLVVRVDGHIDRARARRTNRAYAWPNQRVNLRTSLQVMRAQRWAWSRTK